MFLVNKSFIKFITDFGPLLIFFSFYYKNEKNLIIAIPPFIVATLIALIVVWILEKKIPMIPLTGGILISFFGGLSIYFDNPVFIYMKPTIINIIFAGILFIGNILNKPLLKHLMGASINMKDEGWFELSKRWVVFFIFLAILNEIIWRNFSKAYGNQPTDDIWINFKVFGILILTFIF
mgnify:CR=1 FL=1